MALKEIPDIPKALNIYVKSALYIHAPAVHYVKWQDINQKKKLRQASRKLFKLFLVCQQDTFQSFMDWLILPRREVHFFKASKASMMQQFTTKTFSLNCSCTLLHPFLVLFRPKSKSPFMKNVWLGIYHYGSLSLRCCIISSQRHTSSVGLYTVPGSVFPDTL